MLHRVVRFIAKQTQKNSADLNAGDILLKTNPTNLNKNFINKTFKQRPMFWAKINNNGYLYMSVLQKAGFTALFTLIIVLAFGQE